jgi:outer membrane biosynthesis protein TonB
MEKQIKLTLLGTMLLFTGASIRAMEGKAEAKPVSAPVQQKQPVQQTVDPKTNVAPKTEVQNPAPAEGSTAEVKQGEENKESLFSRGCSSLKTFVTNKWVIGAGVALVGAYVAFRIYQAYNEEEAEAEQPAV